MGLLKWLKKELVPAAGNGHRRRESAPPLLTHILDANSTRDEAYIRALAKFNEWRSNQQQPPPPTEPPAQQDDVTKVKKTKFIDSIIEEEEEDEGNRAEEESDEYDSLDDAVEVERRELIGDGEEEEYSDMDEILDEEDYEDDKNVQKHNVNILPNEIEDDLSDLSSDLELTTSERLKIARTLNAVPSSELEVPKKPKRSVEFLKNKQKNAKNSNCLFNMRMSFPVAHSKIQLHSPQPQQHQPNEKNSKNQEMSYDAEKRAFEKEHCDKKGYLLDKMIGNSPPAKFYHENQSPYKLENESPKYVEPIFKTTAPKRKDERLYRRSASSNRKSYRAPAPPPPPPSTSTELIQAVGVASEQKDEENNNDTAVDSQNNESYKIYNSNSASRKKKRSPNNDKLPKIVKERRLSPPYQTIVNKHGDLVEYALPYSEQNGNAPTSVEVVSQHSVKFIQKANVHFDMLQPSSTAITVANKESSMDPLTAFLERRTEQKCKITDLDKSGSTIVDSLYSSASHHKVLDICHELDSLENWSTNIQFKDTNVRHTIHKNCLDYFQKTQNNLLICWPNEIQHRNGQLTNSFPAPLDFSSGVFRNAPVTLRKFNLINDKSLYYAEEACRRDFDILSHIKHTDIAILMAVSFDSGLNQTALIMEPFEFTLNYYLHQLNKKLSLLHCISVVQQIASATLYLQDCGYIHSNISSHNILMRTYPYCVKLTCFELTTEVSDEVKREIEQKYNISTVQYIEAQSSKVYPEYLAIIKNSEEFIKEKYIKLSKQLDSPDKRSSFVPAAEPVISIRPSRYLPYNVEYRQKFSVYNYQAPELLKSKQDYVFPSQSTDVYSLTLLLWEVTNHCVPFVIFNRSELENLFQSKEAQLPIIDEERSKRFQQIFNYGLELTPGKRLIRVHKLMKMLDEIKLDVVKIGFNKNASILNSFTIKDEDIVVEKPKKKNVNNNKEELHKNDKNYHKENFYENTTTKVDPQKREENAITNENLDKLGLFNSFSFTDVEVNQVTGTDRSADQLFHTELSSIADSERQLPPPKTPHTKMPTKPSRKSKETGNEEKLNRKDKSFGSSFSLSKSGIYQSLLDFNKFLSPKSRDSGVYERTSTIKKRKKSNDEKKDKKSARELFDAIDTDSNNFEKMDKELELLDADGVCSKDDFLSEIMSELQTRHVDSNLLQPLIVKHQEPQAESAKVVIKKNKSKFLCDLLRCDKTGPTTKPRKATREERKKDVVKSCEHLAETASNIRLNKTVTNATPSSYRFTIGDFYLPDTPIARKNKIRKNAWLSDQKLKVPLSPKLKKRHNGTANVLVQPLCPKNDIEINDNDGQDEADECKVKSSKKKVNVSIKILHNNVDGASTFNESNSVQDLLPSPRMDNSMQGINIKVTPLKAGQRSVIKLNDNVIKTFDDDCVNAIEILEDSELLNSTNISRLGEKKLEYTVPLVDRSLSQSLKMSPSFPPEIADAIKKQKDRSTEKTRFFESTLWRHEKSLCEQIVSPLRNNTLDGDADNEESLVTPKNTSVREAIKQIETTFEKTGFDYSPSRRYVITPKRNELVITPNEHPINSLKNPATQLVPLQVVASEPEEREKEAENTKKTAISELRIVLSNNLMKAPANGENSVAAAKVEVIDNPPLFNVPTQEGMVKKIISAKFMPQSQLFQRRKGIVGSENVVPKSLISGLDLSGIEQQKGVLPKKKLTRVTVNLRKISSRRSSDAGQELTLGQMNRQSANLEECASGRHSICGTELLRSLSQLALRDQNAAGSGSITTVCTKQDGAVAQGSVENTRRNSIIGYSDLTKGSYVCCNCGTSMTPANILKIPPGSTISIPSLSDLNITGSFCTSMVDDNAILKDLDLPATPLKRCQAFPAFHEAKSTEDLYIDDDFCQGIGANMELIHAMGSTDFLGSFDFDILSTEVYREDDGDDDGYEADEKANDNAKLQIVRYSPEMQ